MSTHACVLYDTHTFKFHWPKYSLETFNFIYNFFKFIKIYIYISKGPGFDTQRSGSVPFLAENFLKRFI